MAAVKTKAVAKKAAKKKAPVKKKAAKKLTPSDTLKKASPLRNSQQRLTKAGADVVRKIVLRGMSQLTDKPEIIQEIMEAINCQEATALEHYAKAEAEFEKRQEPFTQAQLDFALQGTLRDLMIGKDASPTTKMQAARMASALWRVEDHSDDDEAKCRHYEGMWMRYIQAAQAAGVDKMVEVQGMISSEDFKLEGITESAIAALEAD